MKKNFYKMSAFNFVPFTKTPWGGKKISLLKKKYFKEMNSEIPNLIGESWEVSTDLNYPSFVTLDSGKKVTFTELLKDNSAYILGEKISEKYGNHCPLLLKWLNADDSLSVQLHPKNGNKLLKSDECGKPESWLILDVEKNGSVYLGFKEELAKEQIIQFLLNDEPEKCLHKYVPKKFDYISVPPGCVHAVGAGVFLAEPQYVLPKKSGKTWRISDWRRLYDEFGVKSDTGKPRGLHVKESLDAIDWSLPRGRKLESLLIHNMLNSEPFYGDSNNPFALQVFRNEKEVIYKPLQKNQFTIVTVWGGELILNSDTDSLTMLAGESAVIAAQSNSITVRLQNKNGDEANAAFFALNDEVL